MHLPIGFLARFSHCLNEVLPVHVIQENPLPQVATAHDVIHSPRILDAQLARHADIQDSAQTTVNSQNDKLWVDPFTFNLKKAVAPTQ
jgi:hypothetical protein